VITPGLARVEAALALVTDPPAGVDGAQADAWAGAAAWAADAGIRGFGIRGVRDGRPVLAVYADPLGGAAKRIPDSVQLPGGGAPVPVAVFPLGALQPQEGLTAAFLKPCPGCAVSVAGKAHGTFGCLVRDPVPGGATYMLTAAHVIASSGLADEGEGVFQPRHPRQLGTLSSWGKIAFTDTGFPNLFDAAIAVVDPEKVSPTVHLVGRPTGASSNVSVGMRVQKCGATSVHTWSTVLDSHFSCRFDYTLPGGKVRRAGFQRQVLCRPFTKPGDSGSAVLDEDLKVLGLVVGATKEGTVFSPIGPILTRFGVAIA
jgi:hypothetical protein